MTIQRLKKELKDTYDFLTVQRCGCNPFDGSDIAGKFRIFDWRQEQDECLNIISTGVKKPV